MGLNIKNPEVERLAEEVAELTGVTKTEAIRRALIDRRDSLVGESLAVRVQRALGHLETEVWPLLSAEQRRPLSKEQEEKILGYGQDGV